MSDVVIVTSKCYLLCESVNYISLCEAEDQDDLYNLVEKQLTSRLRKVTGTKKTRAMKAKATISKNNREALDTYRLYAITIDFMSKSSSNSPTNRNGDAQSSVVVTVRGKKECNELFRDIVSQIREQIPDHVFLDKLVDKFLTDLGDKQ